MLHIHDLHQVVKLTITQYDGLQTAGFSYKALCNCGSICQRLSVQDFVQPDMKAIYVQILSSLTYTDFFKSDEGNVQILSSLT